MGIIWKEVPGYPNIEVSNLGTVRTVPRLLHVDASYYRPAYTKALKSSVLAAYSNVHGYQELKIRVDKKSVHASVHRLVCLAFHGPPPIDKPNALHRDGNILNNTPDNLYWGDQKENAEDSKAHGTMPIGSKRHNAKLTEAQVLDIKRRRTAGEMGSLLADEYNISQQTVCDIYKGRYWAWTSNKDPAI